MFKEYIKRAVDNIKLGLGLFFTDIFTKKIKGEFFVTLTANDGTILDKRHFTNVIVDSASLLIARFLASGQTTVDPVGPAHGIWVLATGTGNQTWDKQNPPSATTAQTLLESELARKRFASVNFVQTNGSGLPSTVVTNIIDFTTVFNESEAVGALIEFGLFGGDADDTVPNSGILINYRTFPVINKSNTSSMSIVFRITT